MAGKLKWRRTWPDKPQDFVAEDPETGERVGRIYTSINGMVGEHWRWFGRSQNGLEPTKQEAADALEANWLASKERMSALEKQSERGQQNKPDAKDNDDSDA